MSVAARGNSRDRVLVIGAYGYRNLGDEAILSGLLAKLGRVSVTVVSRNPGETARMHRVAAIGIGSAVAALRRHESVVIGGGGLFGRDVGRLGRLLPVYGLLAAGLGKRVLVDGVDLDEQLPLNGRLLVPALMRSAARVSVRDRRSAEILGSWGVSTDVAPDLSSLMPAGDPEAGTDLLQAAGVDLRRPVIGLALTALGPTAPEAIVAAACGAMDGLPEAEFCFVPMSRHPWLPEHDDMHLAERIRTARPRLAILHGRPHPAAVLAAYGHLSAVVAMRYHALLFAARAGTPIIPLAYAEKSSRWLREHNVPAQPAAPGPIIAALRAALASGTRAAFEPVA